MKLLANEVHIQGMTVHVLLADKEYEQEPQCNLMGTFPYFSSRAFFEKFSICALFSTCFKEYCYTVAPNALAAGASF